MSMRVYFFRSVRPLAFSLVLVALLSVVRSARANGRYPTADQLLVDPRDSQHLVLRTTFGILQSRDAGKRWTWICEAGVGFPPGSAVDPAVTILADGSIVAGYSRDLRISRADGCDWTSPFSNVVTENLIDVTLDPADPGRALFVCSTLASTRRSRILTVTIGSQLVSELAVLGDDLSPTTLEVAPSRPQRIYVTAIADDFSSLMLRSDDSGRSWERVHIEPLGTLAAYIAAIDPTNPDRVYVRVDGPTRDSLLVTRDAGMTFDEVISIDGDMQAFALSPDGKRVFVGGTSAGLYAADSESLAFAALKAKVRSPSCLRFATPERLLVCAREATDGFTLGLLSEDGAVAPLLRTDALVASACRSDESVGAACPSSWPGLSALLGAPSMPAQAPRAEASSGCSWSSHRSLPASAAWTVFFAAAVLARRRSSRCSRHA